MHLHHSLLPRVLNKVVRMLNKSYLKKIELKEFANICILQI